MRTKEKNQMIAGVLSFSTPWSILKKNSKIDEKPFNCKEEKPENNK